jgi:hypothetical protein
MLFQNDAGARVTFGYACFALFTHPHAVEQRSYLPAIVKRCPWVFGAVKELLGGHPGDAKHNLILPRQVICTFGFWLLLPGRFPGGTSGKQTLQKPLILLGLTRQ